MNELHRIFVLNICWNWINAEGKSYYILTFIEVCDYVFFFSFNILLTECISKLKLFCLNECVATAALYKRFFVFVIITAILGKLGEKMSNMHFSHIVVFFSVRLYINIMHVNRYDYDDVIVKVFQLKLRGKICLFLSLYYDELNRVHCLELPKQNYRINHIH